MIDAEIGLKNLIKIQEILGEIGEGIFLCEGTLLGAIRENKFLDHDTNIDIGVFYESEEKTNSIIESLKEHFEILRVWCHPDLGVTEISLNTPTRIDIFFYFQEGHNLYNVCLKRAAAKMYLYEKFDLVLNKFLGHLFYMPADPIKYLATKYGDYKTVKTDWDWFDDPLNGSHVD